MHYYLYKDKTIMPCDFETWAAQLQEMTTSREVIVAQSVGGYYRVITIWVGVNLDPACPDNPKVFSTQVYKGLDLKPIETILSSTWDEAMFTHEAVKERIVRIDETEEKEDEPSSETAHCRHGLEIHCKECYEECEACGGAGGIPVPKTYMTCPCCREREKIRICKKCHGKGYE